MPFATGDFKKAGEAAVTMTPHSSMDAESHRNFAGTCYAINLGGVGIAALMPHFTIPLIFLTLVNEGLQRMVQSNRNRLLQQSDEIFLRGNDLVVVHKQPHIFREGTIKLNAHWAEADIVRNPMTMSADGDPVIRIRSRNETAYVGRFLPPEELEDVTDAINAAVLAYKSPSF